MLWVGGSWAVGYLVVPILFARLGDRQLAGTLAGWLFAALGQAGLVVGMLLALFWVLRAGRKFYLRPDFWIIVMMSGLTALALFAIQPMISEIKALVLPLDVMQSPMRDRFVFWHGVSSILYLLQSLLGLWLVIRSGRLETD